ncbi:TPA: DNA-binding protein [Salmonella enterica subsp. enterica serovar Hvittingfoss]|nr:DNA-binding protein [Salmonella enterica subsp. enterica serovar Hvittingfoss]
MPWLILITITVCPVDELTLEYQIEKYSFCDTDESPRLAHQRADVMEECRREKEGSKDRLRIALLNVDYVTSFELPFRLLLTRTPQFIDQLRKELHLSQKSVTFNGKCRGTLYSIQADINGTPDSFRYRFSNRIRRVTHSGITAEPYQYVVSQVKSPRERLRMILESGLQVNALDGLFWLELQRIAADVAVLRKEGLEISTSEVEVFDSLTGTIRVISAYNIM